MSDRIWIEEVGDEILLHLDIDLTETESQAFQEFANRLMKMERERIIALLEESQAEAVWCDADEECNHVVTCHDIEQWLDHVIFALIKGENK